MLNLDTHIIVHFLENQVTEREKKILGHYDRYCISDIVLWELAWLVADQRNSLDPDGPDFGQALSQLHVGR